MRRLDVRIDSIVGLRFNEQGVVVTEAQKQATWARHVADERARRRREPIQEDDVDGLAARQWDQR